MIDTVRWKPLTDQGPLPGVLRLIDQTKLPETFEFMETDDAATIHDAIRRLVVRGAPAIGCAAALGLTAVLQHSQATDRQTFLSELRVKADYLATSRPTAVNLFWALDRCVDAVTTHESHDVHALKMRLWQEADEILREDIDMCKSIGRYGRELISDGDVILTHCNAGALATGDYGTALAPMYAAHEAGMKIKVFADETRPLLQGSRLTAWELNRAGIDVTINCDNMAGQLMKEGRIDRVIVGTDRVAANGDVANKIGTYSVAVLAKYHNVPFYVACPYSTIDLSLASGDLIPIEQRDGEEVANGFGRRTAPEGVPIFNPAFDVTPHELVTAIITDRGIVRPPYVEALKLVVAR